VKASKYASAAVAFILTGVVFGVHQAATSLAWVDALPSSQRKAALCGVIAVTFLILLVPIGHFWDRSIGRLRSAIDKAGNDAQAFEPGPLPAGMRSIARACIGAIDRFEQREQALRLKMRDMEIRHHIAEGQRRQVEAVLHALRDAVLVTDAYGDIVMANETAAGMFGFDLAEAIHKPIDQIIDDSELVELMIDVRDQGNVAERRNLSHEHTDADGVVRLYDTTMMCVENPKHEVVGVVTILRDLSREQELGQMKTEFVSKASHELRTPLSSMKAYVEMLVDDEAKDEAMRQEWCNIIFAETERLERLIDNMLNISRIEAGIVQIDRQSVNLSDVIQRACDTIEPQARDRSITMHNKPSSLDLTVEGDGDMLFQVILNLMSNAVKYTPEGGRVTVSADTDNLTRSVVVSVQDTGLGIPPDALPRLFEKFYRVDNYKRVAKGTGLGLSLCKHIVESLHHGQIGVDSELGMGSRFWFSIPMRYVGSSAAA